MVSPKVHHKNALPLAVFTGYVVILFFIVTSGMDMYIAVLITDSDYSASLLGG